MQFDMYTRSSLFLNGDKLPNHSVTLSLFSFDDITSQFYRVFYLLISRNVTTLKFRFFLIISRDVTFVTMLWSVNVKLLIMQRYFM